MGVAWYIALDVDEPAFDADVDGKTLARHEARINELAADYDMPDLATFFGMGGDDIADVLGDEDDIAVESTWHSASDGVLYFDRLAELAVENDLPGDLVEELQQFATVLRHAAAAGVRWHLAIDI
jgi:hypothetical protein